MDAASLFSQFMSGLTTAMFLFLIASGLSLAFGVALLGAVVERLLFRLLYDREELYQLLFTYALVLILGDAAKLLWGTQQLSVSGPPALGGGIQLFGTIVPVYNLFIMLVGPAIAIAVWLMLTRT